MFAAHKVTPSRETDTHFRSHSIKTAHALLFLERVQFTETFVVLCSALYSRPLFMHMTKQYWYSYGLADHSPYKLVKLKYSVLQVWRCDPVPCAMRAKAQGWMPLRTVLGS